MPVSRVSCGFAAGDADYLPETRRETTGTLPFGGSSSGVSVQPVGFLVVGHDQVRLLPVDANPVFDRLIDMTPSFMEKLKDMNSDDWKRVYREQGEHGLGMPVPLMLMPLQVDRILAPKRLYLPEYRVRYKHELPSCGGYGVSRVVNVSGALTARTANIRDAQ